MLNKRTRNNNNCRKFKSYTDINNYNKFLIELDKNNTNKIENETKQTSNSCSTKNDIKNYLKHVNNDLFKIEYTNPNFTGMTYWDSLLAAVEKQIDPNLYNNDNHKDTDTKHFFKENKTDLPFTYKHKVNIVAEINNIGDLLTLIETYPYDRETEYNINMSALHKIKKPLIELNEMIGMKELKESIIDQIIFYVQNLHTLKTDDKGNDFMHTVIYGPPGTGKTEIAKIIGSIFSKMGILTKGTFKKVTRTDLVAGYLGQTALKTRDIINECLGGVLFIDEAYALGNEEKKDSFSKECIDTICEALSDHKENLMVIIAGYETDLNQCFFNYNQGLNSRFTWRFKTDEYTGEDLYRIFLKKVKEGGWSIEENSDIDIKWFEKNKKHFKFYGRDIETLFAKTKITHSRRVFCLDSSLKKKINILDLDKGLEIYLRNEDSKIKDNEKIRNILSSMYI
jgi:ATP-dependent 26S proteasome regulatory subunit